MGLFLISIGAMNLFLLKLDHLAIGQYIMYTLGMFTFILFLNFLIGIVLYVTGKGNSFIWFIFGSHILDYDVENVKQYILRNMPRIVITIFAFLTFYKILERVV